MKRNFTFLMAAFALMVMLLPLPVVADSYTITFKTGTGDGTSVTTSMECSDLVSSGDSYLSGNVATATNVYYNGSDGLKLGKSSDGGAIKMYLSNLGQVTPTSIVVNAKLYNSSKSATLKVNGSSTQSVTSNFSNLSFNITNNITYLELISSKYIWVKSITVNYDSNTPYTVTFNPGSGACSTPSLPGTSGSSINLPTAIPSTECANVGWTFAGWATQSISETTTAPTLHTGSYTITGDATLYAVYRVSDGGLASTTANMNFSNGSYSNSTITWTIPDVVSILQEKHNGQTEPNSSYVGSPRWYSGNKITITPSVTLTSISVTTTTEGYATALENSTYTNATATASVTNVTITPTNGSDAIVIVMGGQSRLSALSVSYASASYIYATSPSCSVQQQVATPTFSPAAGTYTEAQNVTISCATSGATIYYTTDGTEPSTNSNEYSSAIPVSTNTTIKAIAVKEGMANSAVAEATYTIEGGGGDGTIYTLYSGNLVEGDYIIYYSGRAMKNTVSSNRLEYKEVTPSNDRITTSDDAIIWHIAPSGNYWTIYNEAVDKYAASTGTKNQAQLLSGDTDDKSLWTVEGNSTYEFVNKKNNANGVNDHLRNNGSYGFACYSSETGGALSLYRSTAPSIVVNQTIELAHDATSGAFDYSITNPVAGTSLMATSNADWITDVTVGTDQVTFTTTANTTGVERTGTIELHYEGAQDKTVTVSQAAIAPVIETTNAPTSPFAYTATTGSFDFTVTNPVDGATTIATSTSDWITNVAVSGNTVNFQMEENNDGARSGEITLTYAKNGTTLATATVNIHQDSNPDLPGSFENPYTVAEAVAATPSSGSSEGVYVRGIVSEIIEIEVMQYHNARYNISDDGSTSSAQLLAFYGRNINNTDFLSEDELLVGDEVVVYGQLKKYNNVAELDRDNYIVSLTRTVQPVIFSPGSCVLPNSVWVNLFTESVFDYDEPRIYYTTNGNDPRTDGNYFDDAWAADIELTQTTTLKAAVYVPELDKWSAITEATYTIVPEGTGGWQGNPYTVAEALDALDENNDIKGAYVQGIVSRVSQIDTTQYYNATYYISDDGEENNELYVFRGKYISHADFTSTDQLKPGDRVTVYGDLTIYGNTNPVKEFKPKNYIEDWYRPASIMISPDLFEFSSNATSGIINVIYSSDILVNAYNPTVQFCNADGETATYDWLTVTPSQANDWDLEFVIDANENDQPRTAYLRVWGRDNQSNDIVSNIISITQSEYIVDFATLDFYFNGGHSDIADTPGLTGESLGTYSAEDTRLKFATSTDDKMSMLVLKINETPGVLTYNIRGYDMVGGTFKVQESSNGITYSDVASYSGLANDLQSVTIDNLSPSTRYIRWIYVTKNKGNVGVGNIYLCKPINTSCEYAFSVNGQMGNPQSATMGDAIQMPTSSNITFNGQTFTFRGWTTDADDVTNMILSGSSFTLRQDVTFYAVYNQSVTGTEAEKHYAKVTRELSDWSGKYLIVYEGEDEASAFNGGLDLLDVAHNRISVTISNGIITSDAALVAAEFTIAAVDDGYSIKSASGQYIGHDAYSNGLDTDAEYDDSYANTISYNEDLEEICITGAGGAELRFNKNSDQQRFRYYKSGQQGIQLFRYVGGVSNLYTRIFMDETASSVTVEGPSIIPNGSVLNVASITNTLGANRLIVDEGGQLVTSNNVNATVRKAITPYAEEHGKDNYYLVASPVNNLNPETAGMTDDNFDLFAFDQEAQGEEWRNYKVDHFNLAAGQGYLYANDYGGFINMGGTMAPVADDVTIHHVSGKTFAGLHLIGNPYPCNVTINKPFYRLVEGGADLATRATDNSVAIAPMEGVFVYAESATETVSFTKAPTTSTIGGRNLLSMRVSRRRGSKDHRVDTDNAIVRFGDGAMLRKMVLNPNLTQLYVSQNGTDYAIVNAEAEGEMPVSFRAAENGSYTFSVAAEGVTMRYLHLIDNMTGADVDLLQTPYYSFEAQTGDYESRFKLVFSLGAPTTDDTFAYYNGSQWVVDNDGQATLQVIDLMGRVLSSQTINGSAEVNIGQAAGIYMLRLVNDDNVKVQKVVVR